MNDPGFVKLPIIGLCGRSGSGKTTVCNAFERLGVKTIDTDKVYSELVHPNNDGLPSRLVREIAAEFGGNVIASDGSLNRTLLAAAVFGKGNEERLKMLNFITHGPILERTLHLIGEYEKSGAHGVIVDAPALFESGFHSACDAIVCISAPEDVLLRRIMSRDSVSESAARRRLASQISDSELRRRSDYIIENDGERDLFSEVSELFEKISVEFGAFRNNEI